MRTAAVASSEVALLLLGNDGDDDDDVPGVLMLLLESRCWFDSWWQGLRGGSSWFLCRFDGLFISFWVCFAACFVLV